MSATQHRVFISSTFHDLAEHRKALAEVIREIGGRPVLVEDFGPYNEPIAKRIHEEVAESDAVVMLVG